MLKEQDEPEPTGSIQPVVESNVSFRGADGAVTLVGTLAIPSGGRGAPAAILVSGTRPLDRDVTFVGHALLRVMARRLAHAAIATLRFDKRGVGEAEGDFLKSVPDDFVADVIGAVEYLVDGEGFARERTGLGGHSEGGMVALFGGIQDAAHALLRDIGEPSPVRHGQSHPVVCLARTRKSPAG